MFNLPFLKRSAELRKIVANTGWLFADKILRMGVGLFVGVWVARYLGVEQFGTLNFAAAFVGLFGVVSNLGLPSLVIRTLTHEPENRNQVLGTTFWLQFLGGVVSLILLISTIFLFRSHDPLTIALVSILGAAGILQAFDTIDLWFQSQVQSKYTVIAKNTAFLLFAIVKIGLINTKAPLIAFAFAAVGEVVAGAIGLVTVYQFQVDSVRRWRWNFKRAKRLLQESWPLILSSLAITVYMKIDQIMLSQMVGDTAVGLYASAVRVSEIWYFIPVAIVSSVAPSIYDAKRRGDETLYYQRIKKLLRLLGFISIALALPISFLSERIIFILFGNEFIDASHILSIHIWASLFVFVGVGASPWFISESLTHLNFIRTCAGAISNVVLNLLLIPIYGEVGAAIATVISYAVGSFLWNFFDARTRKIFTLQFRSLLFG